MAFRSLLSVAGLVLSAGCQQPFDAAMQRADQAAHAGKWADARAAYEEATRHDAMSAEAWARLGAAAWFNADPDLAITAWHESLQRDPRQPVALEGVTRAALQAHDAGAAVAATLLDPLPPALRLPRARALLALGTGLEEARALLDAQLLQTPDDAATLYVSGSVAIAQRRFADAQEHFDRLHDAHRASPLGSYGLARLASAQRRPTDTLFYLAQARATAGSRWQPAQVAADPAFGFLAQSAEFKALVGK